MVIMAESKRCLSTEDIDQFLRQITLNLLKKEKSLKVGIANKRLNAGWGHDYLLRILGI